MAGERGSATTCRIRRRVAARTDAGQVGGIEALPFGILVFVVGALLVANAWAVVDAKLAVDAAARQATRQYVEADASGDPEQTAIDAGLATVEAYGRDPANARVRLSGRQDFTRCARATFTASYEVPALTIPWIGGFGDGIDAGLATVEAYGRDPANARISLSGRRDFTRCARATFTASYEVPALTIPWIGGFGDGIDVTSRHSELVDPYRSGVPGTAASCG